MEIEEIKKNADDCLGLSLFDARTYFTEHCPQHKVEFFYTPVDSKGFVLDYVYDSERKTMIFVSGCDTFLEQLPLIYRENNLFLENFAMVFQHIINSVDITLDNIHLFFSPMKAPKFFLPVLADWLQVDLSLLSSDTNVIRKVIQFAVPLYKLRGTAKGLRLLLYIVTGILPDIYEGVIPFNEMSISTKVDITSPIFGNLKKEFVFYVYFPVIESKLSDNLVKRIHKIVQREKPAYMQAYVCFKSVPISERDVTTFAPGMDVMGEDGIVF